MIVCLTLIAILTLAAPATASSMMYHNDPAHLGVFDDGGIKPGNYLLWKYTGDAYTGAAPLVVNDTVFTCGVFGRATALDAATGAVRWQHMTGLYMYTMAVVAEDTVYTTVDIYISGTHRGYIFALDATTGETKWNFHDTGGAIFSTPVVASGVVYFGCQDGRLYALDAATGALLWKTGEYPGGVSISPAVANGMVYFGDDYGFVTAVSTGGGYQWAYLPGGRPFTTPVVTDNAVYVACSDGYLYAINPYAGTLKWKVAVTGYVSPSVADGVVYTGSGNSAVALDAATGATIWTYTTGGVAQAPVICNGTAYVGSRDGKLYALDATDGALEWTYTTGSEVGSPVIANGTIYVGCSDYCIYAIGVEPKTANFAATPITEYHWRFNDTSTGGPLAWQWNFGDGSGNVTTRNATHTYASVGAYDVMLTVTFDTQTITTTKQVDVVLPLVAGFTPSASSGEAPLSVQFTNTSTGYPQAWNWNFGDGTGNVTTPDPAHTFAGAGTYNVMLTVTNGSRTSTAVGQITVITPLVAGITTDATSGEAPLSVQFGDASTGYPQARQWNFGDGTGNVTSQNPAHTFASPGLYDVMLTVTNDSRTSTAVHQITVVTPLVAGITSGVVYGEAPLSVQFNDGSTGYPQSWSWNFGDGSPNVTTSDASHTFASPGTYDVMLTVTNDSRTRTAVRQITVVTPLVAGITTDVTYGEASLSVQLSDASAGYPRTWQWNFGDGSPNVTTSSALHCYNSAGTYEVMLTVTNGSRSDTAVCQIIAVVPLAVGFSANVTTGLTPLCVKFSDTSAGYPQAWQWNFGDGTGNVTSQNPTHTFAGEGEYDVMLTVTNGSRSSTTGCRITAIKPLVAGITANATYGEAPMSVRLDDVSTGYPQAWDWNFGDGTGNVTDRNTSHTFAGPGTYDVMLTVTNDSRTSTAVRQITVVRPLVATFTANVTSGLTPLAVQLIDTGDGYPQAWQWNFGDGTPNVTVQNPMHTFLLAKTYTVVLTVTNGSRSSTASCQIVVSPSFVSSDAPGSRYRSSLNGTGVYTSGGIPTDNSTVWQYTTGGWVLSSPALVNGTVYIGSYDRKVYALDAGTGALKWQYATGGYVEASPAVANDTVYIGSYDGKLYALNASTGTLLWTYSTGVEISSSPAVANGTVYFGNNGWNVYALDAATGTLRWMRSTGSNVGSSPAVFNDTVYVGCLDSNVYALDAGTGAIKWQYATGDMILSSPAVACGIVYIGSDDHKVYALNAGTGTLVWQYETGDAIAESPAVAGGIVYAGSEDGKIYALNAATGAQVWTYTTGGEIHSSPTVADGIVYAGSDDNKVYALNAATGTLEWVYTTGGEVFSSPVIANGIVYAGSWDGNVYAIGQIPLVADFAGTGSPGNRYEFTDGSAGNPWTWQWSFGDGSPNATTAVASHTFPSTGTYTVTMTVTHGTLSSTIVRQITVVPFVSSDAQGSKFRSWLNGTGVYDDGGIKPGNLIRWKYMTGDEVRSSPAIVGNTAYIGSDDGYVYALDVATGSVRWQYLTADSVRSSPAVVNGTVYVGSMDGKVYALATDTGTLKWQYTTSDAIESSPAIANNTVYIGSNDGKVYALDVYTGALKWQYTTSGAVRSSPAVCNDTVYFGSDNYYMYALNATTGARIWYYYTTYPVRSSPAVWNDTVYIGKEDKYVYALNASTGTLNWKYRTLGEVSSSPAVYNGVVYFGSYDRNVTALDASTGDLKWQYKTGYPVESSPAVANGIVYVGSDDDRIYGLDAGTGEVVWQYLARDEVTSSPAVACGTVYVGSKDGYVYAIGATTRPHATIRVPVDYPTIGEALFYAEEDDTILVGSGTYAENVELGRTIALIGVDTGAGLPVIDGDGDTVVTIYANNTTVRGFRITNGGTSGAGIDAEAGNVTVADNFVNDSYCGIFLAGSSNSTVTGNTVSDIGVNGIGLQLCDGVSLAGNTVSNSGFYGILMIYGNGNNLTGNTVSNSAAHGIAMMYGEGSGLTGNTVSGSGGCGIIFALCAGNRLTGNIIVDNEFGIALSESEDNVIWLNLISGNSLNAAMDGEGGNSWNSTVPLPYRYNGRDYVNYTGNFWGDYSGTDINRDGIGDEAVVLNDTNIDRCPMLATDLTAGFTASPAAGTAPLAVRFSDTSAGFPQAWQWNFGDGTPNATVPGPAHTYDAAGTYTVTLTVSNSIGKSTVQKVGFVTVSAAGTPSGGSGTPGGDWYYNGTSPHGTATPTPTPTPTRAPTATSTPTPTGVPTVPVSPTPVPGFSLYEGIVALAFIGFVAMARKGR